MCGDGGGGAWARDSCNKLHGASCNINKFIKRPYHIRISMDVERYIDVAQITDTSKRFLIGTGNLKSNQSERDEVEVISNLLRDT